MHSNSLSCTLVLQLLLTIIVVSKVILFLLQTVYFYSKSEECSYEAMKKIGKELNSSLPGTDSLILRRTVCDDVGCDWKRNKLMLSDRINWEWNLLPCFRCSNYQIRRCISVTYLQKSPSSLFQREMPYFYRTFQLDVDHSWHGRINCVSQ